MVSKQNILLQRPDDMPQIFVPECYRSLCLKHDSLVLSKPWTQGDIESWRPARFGELILTLNVQLLLCSTLQYVCVCTKKMWYLTLTLDFDLNSDLDHLFPIYHLDLDLLETTGSMGSVCYSLLYESSGGFRVSKIPGGIFFSLCTKNK